MSEYDASSITVLRNVDAVRRRPGMYFGDLETSAANEVVIEVVANAVDQYLAGSSTKVAVEIESEKIRISDDGPGMPFSKRSPDESAKNFVEYCLLNLHATPTADRHSPHIHLGATGVGLCAVNAVCERLVIKSHSGGVYYEQSFERGKVESGCEPRDSSEASGTTIELVLDDEIFEGSRVNETALRESLLEVAHFFPGLVVEFQDERFFSRDGLLDLARIHYEHETETQISEDQIQFSTSEMVDRVQVAVAAVGEVDKGSETKCLSWVNGSATVLGGVHVDSLTKSFSEIGWKPKVALVHAICTIPDSLTQPRIH